MTKTCDAGFSGKFSPLRYPGGKGKLARFVSAVIKDNKLYDGTYVEPYAGGAAIAWELLINGLVRRVIVNDVSLPIFSFWNVVLNRTDEFVELIRKTPVTVSVRDRLKEEFSRAQDADELTLAFATFFLNRTNRSGILNGGMIGGRAQSGPWKLDARFNKEDLIGRIERISQFRRQVTLTRMDAIPFIKQVSSELGEKSLVYSDPPYYNKGKDLYYNFYTNSDHRKVAEAITESLKTPWIVSYDDVSPIHDIYAGAKWLQYSVGYSARQRVRGREAMFASNGLILPPVLGSMVELDRWDGEADAYRRPMSAVA